MRTRDNGNNSVQRRTKQNHFNYSNLELFYLHRTSSIKRRSLRCKIRVTNQTGTGALAWLSFFASKRPAKQSHRNLLLVSIIIICSLCVCVCLQKALNFGVDRQIDIRRWQKYKISFGEKLLSSLLLVAIKISGLHILLRGHLTTTSTPQTPPPPL